jgi:amino acid transporter
MVVMLVVTLVYMAVLTVSVGTFPDLAGHANPVAGASAVFMGPLGGTIIAAGICISVFGTNAGAAFVSPRRIFAMADRRDLPGFLARVSGAENVPRPAIVATWFIALLLTLTGTFEELAVLGVVARFMQYIPTCIALMVFRFREEEQTDGFRVPMGPVIPMVTVFLCVGLLIQSNPQRLLWGLYALLAGIPFFFLSRYLQRRA